MTSSHGPGSLGVLSLLAEVVDDVVVSTVRDTHLAWLDRTHQALAGVTAGGDSPHHVVHGTIARGVYGSIGLGLTGVSRGLDALTRTRPRPTAPRGLEASQRGRLVRSAVNGIIGDRLEFERPEWAIPMAVRRQDRDVPLEQDALARIYPDATGSVVVFMHGWCETESQWDWQVDRRGPGYPAALEDRGWTPVLLRANTGLPVRSNGAALASLLGQLTAAWPVPITRIALIGHSMGGLIIRAATAVVTDDHAWADLVTNVVTLGTPHLGAPLAAGVGHGSRALSRLPETGAFGRILDQRSAGVEDLVAGLGEETPSLPHARYHLVSGTVTSSPRHPVGRFFGDALVRQSSAYGTTPGQQSLFPDAELLHVPGAGHLDLLNHPLVHEALAEWLA